MKATKAWLGAALALVILTVPAAADENDVSMTLEAQTSGTLSVVATAGRYDRLATATLDVSAQLDARIASGSRKILASELLLRQHTDARAEIATKIADGAAPQRAIEKTQTVQLALAQDGTIARDAIAACNAGNTATVTVPLIWRVTTGRFNFRWTDYDHVAPTQEFAANPDFYNEREVVQREVTLSVPVDCAPLPASGVANVTVPKPAAKPAPMSERAIRVAETASVRKVEFVPAESARSAPAQAPVCQGGMVREFGTGEGYLCLCPGNTTRIASGDNAFSCERRARRN